MILSALKEMPWSLSLIAAAIIVGLSIGEVPGLDRFELESQLEGTQESLKVCRVDLETTRAKALDTDLWMREFRAEWLEARATVAALQVQNDELREKHEEAITKAAEAVPVSSVATAPAKVKKPVKTKQRAKKPRSKDWLEELVEAMS